MRSRLMWPKKEDAGMIEGQWKERESDSTRASGRVTGIR